MIRQQLNQATGKRLFARLFGAVAALVLGGCAITIRTPAESATVGTPTTVVIDANADYTNLSVIANGVDVSSQFSAQGNRSHQASLRLPQGLTLLQAAADVDCWYCQGRMTRSVQQRRFTVFSEAAFIDVSAGDSHTCAVDANNVAWCWGDNTFGQLGTGAAPDLQCGLNPAVPARPCRPQPVRVDSALSFRSVSAGQHHTCGLTVGGDVLCWGRNQRGQLGDGSVTDRRAPVRVPLSGQGVAVAAGGRHSCAINTARELHCWGDNSQGQLGSIGLTGCPTGTGCSVTPSRQGTGFPGGSFLFSELSAGMAHTCAIGAGNIKCWGENTDGQLGIGTVGSATGGASANLSVNGQFLIGAQPAGSTLGAGVSAGGAHTCALRASGGVDCWGSNRDGQFGGSWPAAAFGDPRRAAAPFGGTLGSGVAAGASHTCALVLKSATNVRTPACAGRNNRGQLGNGATGSAAVFVDVRVPSATQDYFKVAAGGGHSCAIANTGRLTQTASGTDFKGALLCWGDNSFGQVGQNFQSEWTSPVEVRFP